MLYQIGFFINKIPKLIFYSHNMKTVIVIKIILSHGCDSYKGIYNGNDQILYVDAILVVQF